MKTIFVKEFSKFPGPRFVRLGPNSGEKFRDEVLIPAIQESGEISVNLDGTFGYGSSFLEESFGGLVRAGISESAVLFIRNHLVSDEDSTYITEVQEYIDDALKEK